ncbi:hypothetical protein [Paenibacillus agricola]|uniref:Uncharacterized protein n=1 Tax=Paenibacillus agricola TaxID=2716264 RepID=A0ABX0J7K7_9BACL|nr:hypothetical protein [Paenibacillus agricola]NHN30852.1 hypothetical protein [Paenibacillus agricola]
MRVMKFYRERGYIMGYTPYSYMGFLLSDSEWDMFVFMERFKQRFGDTANIRLEEPRQVVVFTIDDWSLRIAYNEEPYVLEESAEIAEMAAKERPDQAQLAACKRRLETSADPDRNMDYFNAVLMVLEWLESEYGAIIFDSQEGSFV